MVRSALYAALYGALAFVVACSDGSKHPKDAAVDAAPDAPPDAFSCTPATNFFTGEIVDWDSSSNTEGFCGVFQARFEVHGDATRKSTTNPNGRFQICLASPTVTRVDITPPTDPSQCTSPASTYTMPGIAIADPAVIASGQLFSARAFTMNRQSTLGVILDPAKAHVFVHVDGTQAQVTIDATHDPAEAFDGTMWGSGDTGVNVFFPNVDPSAGTATVAMTGATAGAGTVPVVAATITYVTLVAP
ncbi:MAG TPA: hypothetical protein VLX92_32185 [Kofleriaceae bacterium]|nr:hypothetical protein [Kofleriaceae bacterium]